MRFQKQRIKLCELIIRYIIIPLAGRGLQIIRQDERAAYNGAWLHHAPMCGANHYHHTRPITTRCTCGAEKQWREEKEKKIQEGKALCPECKGKLEKIYYPSGHYLNFDQFWSQQAGTWFCTRCKGTRGKTGYRYYWDNELIDAK